MWTPFAIDAKGGEMKTKGSMLIGGAWVVVINDKGGYCDEIVIDANMDLQWPHRMSLMPPSPTCSALTPYKVVCALKNLIPSWQSPCTHKARSWSHHFVEDVEDPTDDAEDPRDCLEALEDNGESHEDLEPLMKTLMTLKPW